MRTITLQSLLLVPYALGAVACASCAAPGAPPPPPPPPGTGIVFVGAGDIADCSSSGDEATAALLDNIGGTVFTVGDNAYDDGTTANFTQCYEPSWGRHTAASSWRSSPSSSRSWSWPA